MGGRILYIKFRGKGTGGREGSPLLRANPLAKTGGQCEGEILNRVVVIASEL